jgi:hypothetical protein
MSFIIIRDIFVMECHSGSFLRRTQAGTTFWNLFFLAWYNKHHPSLTKFWDTLYVPGPFSKEK